MYDITLCTGGTCPFKQSCRRFTAEVLGRQDFFGSVPFCVENQSCEHFLLDEEAVRLRAYYIWEQTGNSAEQCWYDALKA